MKVWALVLVFWVSDDARGPNLQHFIMKTEEACLQRAREEEAKDQTLSAFCLEHDEATLYPSQ